MADEEEDPRRSERGRASKLALEAAGEIADWCERRKKEALEDARQQIRTVWILLGGGVVLLLALPRLVALIDYTAATLPPDAVKEATAALTLMETNETEMQDELAEAETDLEQRETELLAAAEAQASATAAFDHPFDDPLAVWERVGPDDMEFAVVALAEPRNFGLIAVGLELTGGVNKTLLLRSNDGSTWTPLHPIDEEGERILGRLYAVSSAPDGALIASGLAGDLQDSETLLLRSIDGEAWQPVRPSDDDGARIKGRLMSLVTAPDNALIAAGLEGSIFDPRTLLLRSNDGVTWTPLRPIDEAGERIWGGLYSIASAPDGRLIAAGFEETRNGRRVLLLLSTDGVTWTPLRPIDEAGERIVGDLYSIASAPGGRLIAAGVEETRNGRRVLLLLSADGVTWTPLRPIDEAGERIVGDLFSVVSASDGALIATGYEEMDDGRTMLLLRSTGGVSWKPLSFEVNGSKTGDDIYRLFYGSDGTFFSVGTRKAFRRNTPEKRESVASALRTGEPTPDFAVPAGSAKLAEELRQRTRDTEIAKGLVKQQKSIRDQTAALHDRQEKAVEEIKKANENLENALLRTEPLRQASWIATRLAVIALLIFLVQIVVNRYRYLQRLADFYDGRAQAFRMLATSGPTAAGSILHDVSLNDLMAGLSPSSISFGREAEPPTQQLMSILQSAVKK